MRGLFTFACFLFILPTLVSWFFFAVLFSLVFDAGYLTIIAIIHFFESLSRFPAWVISSPIHMMMAAYLLVALIAIIVKAAYKEA